MLMSSSETQEKLDKHKKKIEDKVENTGAPNISWLGDSERIAGVIMLKQNPKG